ncbi:unnamed protein product [Diamesa serratosioi]
MVDIKKFSEIDLYQLFGIGIDATESEIRKAYRKKALICHPDKNPDNPKAAELFHQLSNALAILADVSARLAYDRVLKAKQASKIRNQQLDSKRQKLKSELEARERQASQQKSSNGGKFKTPEEIFKDEVERLMKESKKLLEEENDIMRQHLYQERCKAHSSASTVKWDSSKHRIKLKWSADKNDPANGGYSHDLLHKFLNKYGDIEILLVSTKKTGSAIVEFKEQDAAETSIQYEKGNLENPLKLEWVGDAPKKKSGTTVSDSDYESLVLRQMRQAQERKLLIEKMMAEDEAE